MPQTGLLLLDHLMEIGRVGERPQPASDRCRLLGVGRELHVQRRAELDAADANARGLQPRERRRRILVLDREVATVEAERDVLAKMTAAPRPR